MTSTEINTIRFSILLPTRGRPANVIRFLESIVKTADDIDKLEVILRVDEDDTDSHNLSHPGISVKMIAGPQNSLAKMTMECFAKSEGTYLMLVGDDNVFRSDGWDSIIQGAFEKYDDQVGLVYGNDLIQGRNMCTAPFISRKTWEILGDLFPCDYTGEFIDTHIYDLFFKLRCWGIDRKTYLEDVVIEHLHYMVGKAPFDQTYARNTMTEKNREIYFSLDEHRVIQAKKLVHYIKKHNE